MYVMLFCVMVVCVVVYVLLCLVCFVLFVMAGAISTNINKKCNNKKQKLPRLKNSKNKTRNYSEMYLGWYLSCS